MGAKFMPPVPVQRSMVNPFSFPALSVHARLICRPEIGVAVRLLGAFGSWGLLALVITNRVILYGGKTVKKLFPVNVRSARRVIVFAVVNCQTCTVAPGVAFARLMVADVLPDNCLLIAITVSA